MGFYYIVDAADISNFNRETKQERIKIMSNYNIYNPSEAWIGSYITDNFEVLKKMIRDIEDDYIGNDENILHTSVHYNMYTGFEMKPRRHDSDENNLLIAPFRQWECDERNIKDN